MRQISVLIFPVLFIFYTTACQPDKARIKNAREIKPTAVKTIPADLKLISPENRQYFSPVDPLVVRLEKLNDSLYIDSIEIKIDGVLLQKIYNDKLLTEVDISSLLPGTKRILIKTYSSSNVESFPVSLRIVSDIIPDKYSYQLINTFPHDSLEKV